MRPIILLSIAASLSASAISQASVIQLVCGDEFSVAIDTVRKTADIFQPGNYSSFVDGRKTTLTGGGNLLYDQTVFISDDVFRFRNWIPPNVSFQQATFGQCADMIINRATGVLTYKTGCMLGGADAGQLRCVPGRAGPFEKKF